MITTYQRKKVQSGLSGRHTTRGRTTCSLQIAHLSPRTIKSIGKEMGCWSRSWAASLDDLAAVWQRGSSRQSCRCSQGHVPPAEPAHPSVCPSVPPGAPRMAAEALPALLPGTLTFKIHVRKAERFLACSPRISYSFA